MKPTLEIIDNNDSELIASLTSSEEEAPFAIVDGERLTEMPKDLYIPPGALQVFLEAFSGPLDLLLYLIRKQNLDILDIPIADITRQYTQYIELMQELELELAGEYLLMAAMLAEIKSRMLLPRPATANEEEEDPRAELVRRLQEYERFKKAAEDLDGLPRMERDALPANAELVERKVVRLQPDVTLAEMLRAIKAVFKRADMFAHHHIQREPLSVRQRMTDILTTLQGGVFVPFASLFRPEEGRMGVAVTFMAVLELMREALVEIVQAEPYAPLHVRPKTSSAAAGAAASDVADAENEAALAQPALEGENDPEPLEDWSAAPDVGGENELPVEPASVDLAPIEAPDEAAAFDAVDAAAPEPEAVAVEMLESAVTESETVAVEVVESGAAELETVVVETVELAVAEPEAAAVEVIESAVAESEAVAVEIVESGAAEPETVVVEIVELAVAESETAAVEVVESEAAESETVAVEIVESEETELEAGESEAVPSDAEQIEARQTDPEIAAPSDTPGTAADADDAADVESVDFSTETR